MVAALCQVVAKDAAYFHSRGWMLGTAGNLSAREAGAPSFWITASGMAKDRLSEQDFVEVALDGSVKTTLREGARPSAETSIHQVVYNHFAEVSACYHVHSVEANLASRFAEKELVLPQLEMLKGFGWKEGKSTAIPIFANHAVVPDIACDMGMYFKQHSDALPLALIRDHGITVWAKDTLEAWHYVELAEYILRYIVEAKKLGLYT